MGKQQQALAAPTSASFYRITQTGRSAAAADDPRLRSRHLVDLLGLLDSRGRSMRRCELRQFMPPASLELSINTLLGLGLIELDEPFRSVSGRQPQLNA